MDNTTEPDESDNQAPELALLSFGERLREGRMAKGLSLDDVADTTRISSHHLKALEEGRFDELPGRTYTIGFARAFVRQTGLPEEQMLNLLRDELGNSQPGRPNTAATGDLIEDSGKVPTSRTAWIIAGVGIAALVIGYIVWRSMLGTPTPDILSNGTGGQEITVDEQTGSNTAESETEAVPTSEVAGDTPGQTVPENAPVVFTATEDRIWVKFYDANGDQLMQKEMALGETYTVPSDADGPQLATARPDALSITVAGQVIPPLGNAERVIRDVPVDAKSLLAAPGSSTEDSTDESSEDEDQ